MLGFADCVDPKVARVRLSSATSTIALAISPGKFATDWPHQAFCCSTRN